MREHPYLSAVHFPVHLPTSLYGAMLAVWHLRPVQQRRFPLHRGRTRDFWRYLAWCATEGRRQFALVRNLEAWNEELKAPVGLPVLPGDRWGATFSVSVFLYGVARMRYTFGLLLGDAGARRRVARSFWRGERHKRHEPTPALWQVQSLADAFGGAEGLLEELRFPAEKHLTHAELVKQFGLEDVVAMMGRLSSVEAGGGSKPAPVTLPEKLRLAPVKIPFLALKSLSAWTEGWQKRPNEFQLSGVMRHVAVLPHREKILRHPFGVNLYGYARGEIGIGEDVRLAAAALEKAGVPFCVLNVKAGDNISQQDDTVQAHLSDSPRFTFNIFCVTGVEHARFACEHGLGYAEGRYTIGFWPWEMPRWPSSCHHAYATVDEIWGISSYAAEAYRKSCPHPVIPMTLPVELGTIGRETRADFGLPPDAFLFVFAFDINSKFSRKNPDGVLRAFQRAFPRSRNEKVGLVLKVSHPETPSAEWADFREKARRDPRVFLLEKTLRKPQVLALFQCCDGFVSLHRAEGFGRCLAEALLLGKQVVATGFSGNMDFCHEPRVALVNYQLREVRPREYFWSDGQMWAEPDLEHAAALLREVWQRPRPVKPTPDFSPGRVGHLYAERLHRLWETLPRA